MKYRAIYRCDLCGDLQYTERIIKGYDHFDNVIIDEVMASRESNIITGYHKHPDSNVIGLYNLAGFEEVRDDKED